jgi:hypothetical protein
MFAFCIPILSRNAQEMRNACRKYEEYSLLGCDTLQSHGSVGPHGIALLVKVNLTI